MEQLLNKLIDMGWKPWGREKKSDEEHSYYTDKKTLCFFWNYDEYGVPQNIARYSLRQLVSKESGLWQYVCSRSLIKTNDEVWIKHINDTEKDYDRDCGIYEYRLIESSLRDESELEDFLLDNIKID